MSETDSTQHADKADEDEPEPAPDEERVDQPDIQLPDDAEPVDLPDDATDADGDPLAMSSLISDDDLKGMVLEESFRDPETGHSFSQAHIIADIVNVMRMDTKQILACHNLQTEVNKMSPDRAAELVVEMAKSDGTAIIDVFEAIESQRDDLLQDLLTDAQHQEYMEFKQNMLYTAPGGRDE